MSASHDPHGHDDHGHGHAGQSPFIQHHYDDAGHQFQTGKLGIWFFLAQEVLFFSALFVAYILYRHHRPEIFAYANHYLDTTMGAVNTVVLIVSSLSAAWAVRCAQLGQRRGLVACLAITIVCAFGFLGVKYFEYAHKVHEGILFGKKFDPCVSSAHGPLLTRGNHCDGTKSTISVVNNAVQGCLSAKIDADPDAPGYQATCKIEEVVGATRRDLPACTYPVTSAPPGSLRATLGQQPTNAPCYELVENPAVCPEGPAPLVRYPSEVPAGATIVATCQDAPPRAEPADAFAEPSSTSGLGRGTAATARPLTHKEAQREFQLGPPPEHTNMFFSIYFAMTGLHGIHVLVGIFIFIWLLVRAVKGHFTPDYFGPIDYAALYWHLVDLIWIFLFPLLYLIH